MKRTIISLVCIFLLSTTAMAGTRLLGAASEADYYMGNFGDYYPGPYTGNGCIDYEGNAYFSLRDMAELYGYSVNWDEEKREASVNKIEGDLLIENAETAEKIGIAHAEARYKEDITEKTFYCTHAINKNPEQLYTRYKTFVFFDGDKIDKEKAKKDMEYAQANADGYMTMESQTGRVKWEGRLENLQTEPIEIAVFLANNREESYHFKKTPDWRGFGLNKNKREDDSLRGWYIPFTGESEDSFISISSEARLVELAEKVYAEDTKVSTALSQDDWVVQVLYKDKYVEQNYDDMSPAVKELLEFSTGFFEMEMNFLK